jgi:hypothetical protein
MLITDIFIKYFVITKRKMPNNKNRSHTKTAHISCDILSSQVSLHDQLLIQYEDCNDMDALQMASVLLVQELLFRYNTGGACV